MNTVQSHLKRYPKARISTLQRLDLQEQKTQELRQEINRGKLRKPLLLRVMDALKRMM